jgi:methionyl-tRNA formyltransferase
VCLAEPEPIRPDDDYGSLAARLEQLGADLLIRVLDERPPFVDQEEDGVTYAEKIGPEDRTLDPEAPAAVNERIVRALHPHIGARLQLPDGTFLGVQRARVGADGSLELLEVQPPGGRSMSYADYLRGHAPR